MNMQTLVLMRTSYFGQSAWRSAESQDASLLLDRRRIAARLKFMETISLPSLAAQTDPNFKLLVLSSRSLPRWQKKRLYELCNDVLGEHRVDVLFRRPAASGVMFREHIHQKMGQVPVTTQVVLDDDDALADDFMEILKPEADAAFRLRPKSCQYAFLSFPQGLTLSIEEDETQLLHRLVPFNNQGLSLVGPTLMAKTVFAVAHHKVGYRNAARAIYARRPFYLRTVHGLNDSLGRKSEKVLTPSEMRQACHWFSVLRKHFLESPQENQEKRAS